MLRSGILGLRDRASLLLLYVICVVVGAANVQMVEGGSVPYNLRHVRASTVGKLGPVRPLKLIFVGNAANHEYLLSENFGRKVRLDADFSDKWWLVRKKNLSQLKLRNVFTGGNWRAWLQSHKGEYKVAVTLDLVNYMTMVGETAESLNVQGWTFAEITKGQPYGGYELLFTQGTGINLGRAFQFNPSAFGIYRSFSLNAGLFLHFYQTAMSGISSLLVSAPDQDREKSIYDEDDSSTNLKSEFYCRTSFLFFIFGFFLYGWGWWNAEYGDRPIWIVLSALAGGSCMIGISVLVFGLRCCQHT
jgi:hypothetical protein